MSTISWDDVLDVSSSVSNRGPKIDYEDLFLRPTAPEDKGGTSKYRVKILQRPQPRVVHWANKLDKEGQRVNAPFFDSEFSDKKTRNCHRQFVRNAATGKMTFDKDTPCPWCEAGYNTQVKFVFNVYDRGTKTIRICEVTGKVIEAIMENVKNAREEGEIYTPESWDEAVPDFIITALNKSGKNTFGKGTIDYSATATRNLFGIDDEILEAIVAVHPEASDECSEVGDYKRYLHDYSWYTASSDVATAESVAEKEAKKQQRSGMVVADEDDVADLERVVEKTNLKASLGKKPGKKVVEVVEEDVSDEKDTDDSDDIFDDDDKW